MNEVLDAEVAARRRFKVMRSKNAGPFYVTLDMVFREESDFNHVLSSLTPARLAQAYGVQTTAVTKATSLAVLRAIKISFLRRTPAGHPGCSDCYGMNQEEPLARLVLEILGEQA
jgi:Domain of unknown function (DUF4387)